MSEEKPLGLLVEFARHDARIDLACHSAFPKHSAVAGYIAHRLRTNNGSVLVARLLCEGLGEVGPLVPDDTARVRELSVEHVSMSLGLMCMRLRDIDSRFMLRSVMFSQRLVGGVISGPPLPSSAQRAIASDDESRVLFMSVFNCAYAMLLGIDLRSTQTTRATG